MLTFINDLPQGKALYLCGCGIETIGFKKDVKRQHKTSCGCRQHTVLLTHGMWRTPTWYSWAGMIQRTTYIKASNYARYGGRGIKVCDQWRKFENFLNDMGHRPDGYTLDRIDNDGNYEPSNCRWATPKDQIKNRRGRHVYGN